VGRKEVIFFVCVCVCVCELGFYYKIALFFWHFISHCCPDFWVWWALSFALCAFRNNILWAKLLFPFHCGIVVMYLFIS